MSSSDSDPDNDRFSSSLVLRETFEDSASQTNPLFIPELSNMIIEALGERTAESPKYLNKRSLANLAATCRYLAASIETLLYALDVEDEQLRGLKYAIFLDDHMAISIMNKYPGELLKSCVDSVLDLEVDRDHPQNPQNPQNPQGAQVQVRETGTYTLLHIAAFNNMYDTIIKLHQLGAQWRYCKNIRALLTTEERDTLASSFPAFRSMFGNMNWAPNLACLVKKETYTCKLLTKYWPESFPFVGKFMYPNGPLPGSRVVEYTMTLVHLFLLRAPSQDMSRLVNKALKQYPELKDFPATEHQYSIYHLAVQAQNKTFLLDAWPGVNDRVPHFVDNRGYNPLHLAFIESLKVNPGRNPRSQAGTTQVLQYLLGRRLNPMMPQTKAPYKTPLLMVARNVIIDWNGQNRVIKKNIEDIASAERRFTNAWGFGPVVYSMNRPDCNGNTVLRYITKAIINYHVASGSKPLENLFSRMVTEYGADINLDVNTFPTPYNRPYIHSIQWMADNSTGRRRFKVLVSELGGRFHAAEVAGAYAPTVATANFIDDEPHAPYLPHGHPYALAPPFNRAFIQRSPSEETRFQADVSISRAAFVTALVQDGVSQEEAEATASVHMAARIQRAQIN
ncbi:hypothetical protein FVEN_g10664 [Fusarium venenatum]|uniref:Uncharacterized protein n=1 Tax=Fusarium venenatum TaxID=56646 RepID=A0A2L2SQK4_9HYPO|nr:uncharacterized protein FVRRES_11752 [Fusarium venenatum]KAG8351223.1 hypothetical protein FVEN_g10664 [Fusarium venenatum]KAH6978419.1 hypothetical protein EDB82DRAFT_576765 [Fusarium venenatum]CEI39061.1 unnamed protein product [Fusarium venenatum]